MLQLHFQLMRVMNLACNHCGSGDSILRPSEIGYSAVLSLIPLSPLWRSACILCGSGITLPWVRSPLKIPGRLRCAPSHARGWNETFDASDTISLRKILSPGPQWLQARFITRITTSRVLCCAGLCCRERESIERLFNGKTGFKLHRDDRRKRGSDLAHK